MRNPRYTLLFLILIGSAYLFSQSVPQSSFNASFWNGYADKLQLSPKDREEFITAHKKLHSQTPLALQQNTQTPQSAQKGGGQNNSVFAGPCINADFEMGNFTGWTRTCGFHPGFNPLGCCPNPNGQQAILSGAGNDPYGGFPMVFPGGNFSLRLGNNVTGGEADRVEQTFLVSPANANFSYKYAVVFQDPNHPVNQQPSFQVEMVDTLGNQVPCTFYYVAAGQGISGFLNSPTAGVIYKPWTTVMVDLTPYIGQNITIRFSTYDCSLGGHFGYAYIDGVCQSFSGGGSATVCAGASTTFCAPQGVESYTWTGPGATNIVNQCATVSAPGVYTVSTTLFTGCQGPTFTYTLDTQVAPVPLAGPDATVCANNNTVNISGSISGYSSTPVWSSGGNGVFTSTNSLNTMYTPSAADVAAGSVTITLSTANNGVCPPSVDNMVITITPSPVVNAGTGGSTCNNTAFPLNATVSGGAVTGTWSTSGNGTFSPANTNLNASYTPGPADIAAGSVTLTLTSTNNGSCFADSDTLIIMIKQPATANAGINQSLCSTTPTLSLSGLIGGGSTTGIWSSSGAGAFSPGAANLNSLYSITPADITAGQVTFTLTSTNNGSCPAVSDTVKMMIISPSTVTAGPNQFLCSTSGSVNLSGTVNGFSNTGVWSSSGSGAFNPGTTFLNTSYAFTPADITAGTITFTLTSTNNGPCASVSDTVMMKVRIPATVNAGPNQALCSNAGNISLSGLVSGGSTTGNWSSSGSGVFNPGPSSLTTSYGITSADITSGSVIFTLTSTGNGPCAAVLDTTMISVVNIATLSAGPNQFVCSSGGVINLSGSIISPSNTVAWGSSGIGSFSPSNSIVNPVYNLTGADIAAGSVAFTVTSTNNGPCPAVSDSVLITIKELASINAGPNQNLCSNIPTVNLSGTIGGGATNVAWTSSGTGGFIPNNSNVSTAYGITSNDINAGSVTFTLSSLNNGPCPAVSDTVMIGITKIATVTAGPNQLICSTTGTVNLAGTVISPSNTVTWTTAGSGVFNPNASSANTAYSFSSGDISAGTVVFTITSTNNGVCPAVSDTVAMKVQQLATVNAGASQNICSNTTSVTLNGIIGGGTNSGVWSTSGTGPFVPSSSSLNNTYFITLSDLASGTINFTLTSGNNGPCPSVTDSLQIKITPMPVMSAGGNQYVCSTTGTVQLNGIANSSSGTGMWTSSGGGTYSPGATAINPVYAFTPSDASNGAVTFTFSSTNNGPCPAVSDTVLLKIKKPAVVNAGADLSVCSTTPNINLSGTISVGSTSGVWSTSGTGAFNPGPTVLNTNYAASSSDINNGFVLLMLTSTSNEVCPAVTDTTRLNIFKKNTIDLAIDTTICSYQNPLKISANVSGGSGQYIWTSSGTGTVAYAGSFNNVIYTMSAADIASGIFQLTITAVNNGPCGDMSGGIKVIVNPSPNADFIASSYTVNVGNDPIQFTNQSTGANAYYWNFGDGAFTNLSNPIHTYANADFYQVTLIATNQYNCRDTAVKDIKVVSDITFPNVFTPNPNGGSGGSYNPLSLDNDVFFPYVSGVTEYNLRIFNRWGELIFETNDVKIGWDGYFNGKICQQDAYVWKANVKFFDGRTFIKTGSITLLR